MEQPPPPPPASATPHPNEPQPPPSSSLPLPSSSLPPTPPSSNPNPNPNPNLRPPTSQPQSQPQPPLQNSQSRPPFSRPWQHQTQHFPHFSHLSPMASQSPSSSSSSSSASSSPSPSPSTPPVPPFSSSPPSQRGGMAIGVPAHHPSPPPPSTSFSSMNPPPSFGQQFGGLGRSTVNVPDSGLNSSTSQVRQPIQGMQGMGMTGSLGSPMRPVSVPVHHPQRPVQSSLRPQGTGNNQSPATQNFQGHSLLRVPAVGSPGSPSPSTSQSTQSHNQPWLSSGSHGKPPLPYRPQMNPQPSQQRSHIPQQQHHQSMPTAPQQQQTSSAPQSQPSLSHQPQEHYGQQFPPSRIQSLPHQQQIARGQGLAQKPTSQPMAQPSAIQPGPVNRAASADMGESSTRILSKRSIQELVTQIDPMERLDPEVEDILMDIADEFVESITTFGCSLAKHRKSSTLEAKDILLHLERNWNMTLPGFGGDEIKSYKKPAGSDIHRERLAVIKKSIVASETASTKSSTGQAGGNAKGHLSKPPANIIGSPNPKIREAV